MKAFAVLGRLDWSLVVLTCALGMLGVVFIGSATASAHGTGFSGQDSRQLLGLTIALGLGFLVVLVPYVKVMRLAPWLYVLAVLALMALFAFGTVKNGSRRWLGPAAIQVQPSEFAKLAVIIALAAYLRLKSHARTWDGLLVPLAITLVPAVLVLAQPDLATSLVLWPVWLAMCWAAGAPTRPLLWLLAFAALGTWLAYGSLHGYQQQRIEVWLQHWNWNLGDAKAQALLQGPAYQPWQSLIALGSGGLFGHGLHQGPQNVYGFLPYRSEDYIFAVVGEETGFAGAIGLLLLELALAGGCLRIALRTRERFGRLLCVGVAVYLATQALVHAAVCAWLLPSTGLPLPLISAGRSSCFVTVLAVALVLNVGARREPVLAADGYR